MDKLLITGNWVNGTQMKGETVGIEWEQHLKDNGITYEKVTEDIELNSIGTEPKKKEKNVQDSK